MHFLFNNANLLPTTWLVVLCFVVIVLAFFFSFLNIVSWSGTTVFCLSPSEVIETSLKVNLLS